MNKDFDWTLLGKYLFGECSEEEESLVDRWIERDPKRKVLLGQLHKILRATEESPSAEELDAQALWRRVDQETREEDGQGPFESPPSPSGETSPIERTRSSRCGEVRRASRPRSKESSLRKIVWTGSFAAFITLTAALWLFGPVKSGLQGSSDQGPKTFKTQKGQRTSVRLTDGSQVRLNVDSRLTVLPTFGEEKRVVRLEGEAFFRVRKDSARPFIVRSGETVTRVLGTAFDIGAYPEEDEIKVAVAEGRVHLHTEKPASKKSDLKPTGEKPTGKQTGPEDEKTSRKEREGVVLTKNQVSLISRSGGQTIRREEDLSEHLAWIDGQIAFEDASFEEVIRRLERWYGLEISLRDGTSDPEGELNARFAKDQPLPEVLDLVSTLFGLKYQLNRKTVVFSTRE